MVKKDLIIGVGVGIPVVIIMILIGGGGHTSLDFEDNTVVEKTEWIVWELLDVL